MIYDLYANSNIIVQAENFCIKLYKIPDSSIINFCTNIKANRFPTDSKRTNILQWNPSKKYTIGKAISLCYK